MCGDMCTSHEPLEIGFGLDPSIGFLKSITTMIHVPTG